MRRGGRATRSPCSGRAGEDDPQVLTARVLGGQIALARHRDAEALAACAPARKAMADLGLRTEGTIDMRPCEAEAQVKLGRASDAVDTLEPAVALGATSSSRRTRWRASSCSSRRRCGTPGATAGARASWPSGRASMGTTTTAGTPPSSRRGCRGGEVYASRWARAMASTERRTSSSSVRKLDTEMRMPATPFHTVGDG